MSQNYIIFTDGASRGNPGPGGWGAIIATIDRVQELGGHEDATTNNRMEMRAILEALRACEDGASLSLFTDSQYAMNGATKWVHGWKRNGWKTKEGKDVLNRDLWEEIDRVAAGKHIEWNVISGHVGIPGNERVDVIASSHADGKPVDLYDGARDAYDVDLTKTTGDTGEKEKKQRSKMPAYSYLSLVNGELRRHKQWAECEACVSGLSGVKYRKAISLEDEQKIIEEWGKTPDDVVE